MSNVEHTPIFDFVSVAIEASASFRKAGFGSRVDEEREGWPAWTQTLKEEITLLIGTQPVRYIQAKGDSAQSLSDNEAHLLIVTDRLLVRVYVRRFAAPDIAEIRITSHSLSRVRSLTLDSSADSRTLTAEFEGSDSLTLPLVPSEPLAPGIELPAVIGVLRDALASE
jgi:hypothetical protein